MPLKIIDNDQDYVNYKDIFNNFKSLPSDKN